MRITAEDASNGFRPMAGTIEAFRAPGGPGIRVDSHLYSGYEIPPYYDSLLAKLVAWGNDREEAIARARTALAELQVDGVVTNRDFHQGLLVSEAFLEGKMSTDLLDRVGTAPFLVAGTRR